MCNLPSLPMVRTRCLCISHMAYRESRHDIIIVFHGHRRRRLRTLEGASHGFTSAACDSGRGRTLRATNDECAK